VKHPPTKANGPLATSALFSITKNGEVTKMRFAPIGKPGSKGKWENVGWKNSQQEMRVGSGKLACGLAPRGRGVLWLCKRARLVELACIIWSHPSNRTTTVISRTAGLSPLSKPPTHCHQWHPRLSSVAPQIVAVTPHCLDLIAALRQWWPSEMIQLSGLAMCCGCNRSP